jgi:hypothetical protein
MARDNHQDQHENYQTIHEDGKLMGALPKKEDPRNLQMLELVDTSKSPPPEYNLERLYKKPFTPYHHQTLGSCTISSQAEYVRHVERREQFGRDIFIPEDNINERYMRLSGGVDSGLYELDALNDLRTNGFSFGKIQYKVDAFVEVPVKDQTAVEFAIANFRGVKMCFTVSDTFYHSAPDAVVDDDASADLGGHSMYVMGYEVRGVWVVQGRGSESYSLVDAKDIKLAQIMNMQLLKAKIREADNTPAPTPK